MTKVSFSQVYHRLSVREKEMLIELYKLYKQSFLIQQQRTKVLYLVLQFHAPDGYDVFCSDLHLFFQQNPEIKELYWSVQQELIDKSGVRMESSELEADNSLPKL